MKGKIIKLIRNDYTVLSSDEKYICKSRGKFRNINITPLVGDMVERMGLDKDKLIDLGEDRPKYAINVDSQFCTQKKQFKALVQVCKYQGETVEIEEVTGAEKLRFLMNTSYEYMLYANDKLHKNEIVEMVKICNEVPFYMVFRPETGYTTKEQMKLIITKL